MNANEARQSLPELVKALRDGLEGVTPGPWVAQRDKRRMQPWSVVGDGNKAAVAEISQALRGDFAEPAANAAHIARCSPDNIRLLLDALDRMDAALRAVEARASGDAELHRSVGQASVATALNWIAETARSALSRSTTTGSE